MTRYRLRPAIVFVCLLAAPASSPGQPASEAMRRARAQLGNKRYAEVLRALGPLLSSPRPGMEVLVLATRAAILGGDIDRARRLAERLLSQERAGTDVRAPYYAGMVESSSGAFDRAVPLYERALGVTPGHAGARRELVRALCYLARRADRRRDLGEAARLMERARKLDPGSRGVDRNLAVIRLRAGQPRRAVAPLKRLLRRAPGDPHANRLLGRAYLALGKAGQAEQPLARAVASSRSVGGTVAADAFLEHAVVLAHLGKAERAMVDLKLAASIARQPARKVAIQGRLARIQALLAIRKLERGNRREAWKHLEWALAASAGLPENDRSVVQSVVVLGAVAAHKAVEARRMMRRLKVRAGTILAPAYAALGNPLLAAYVDYVEATPKTLLRAGETFERLAPRVASTEGQRQLEDMASRAFLEGAVLLFRSGAATRAKRAHERVLRRLEDAPPTQIHNAAVLDYYTGNEETAVTTLRAIKPRVPAASCNLAVHHERVYMLQRAYELFRECKKRGGRFPGLDRILRARQRVYGGAP